MIRQQCHHDDLIIISVLLSCLWFECSSGSYKIGHKCWYFCQNKCLETKYVSFAGWYLRNCFQTPLNPSVTFQLWNLTQGQIIWFPENNNQVPQNHWMCPLFDKSPCERTLNFSSFHMSERGCYLLLSTNAFSQHPPQWYSSTACVTTDACLGSLRPISNPSQMLENSPHERTSANSGTFATAPHGTLIQFHVCIRSPWQRPGPLTTLSQSAFYPLHASCAFLGFGL